MQVPPDGELGRLIRAAHPREPWLRVTASPWWAKVLFAAGAQPTPDRDQMAVTYEKPPVEEPSADSPRRSFPRQVTGPPKYVPHAFEEEWVAKTIGRDLALMLARNSERFAKAALPLVVELDKLLKAAADVEGLPPVSAATEIFVAEPLDLELAAGLAEALVRTIETELLPHGLALPILWRALGITKGLRRAVTRDLRTLDLRGFDLSHLDLTGFSLAGATWSKTTRWPPVIVDEIVARSAETQPGVFQIDLE